MFWLVPMRDLRGEVVFRWSEPVWAGLFAVAAVLFGQLVVRAAPDVSGRAVGTMLVLFGAFGVVPVAFWGWFRMRDQPAA